MNGTFCNNRRLRDNEPVLLNHGDCIQLRHAAKIYLVQPNVEREDVEELLGAGGDVKRIEKNFRISNRLVGQGGMAKVSLSDLVLKEDILGTKSCLTTICCMQNHPYRYCQT